MLAQAVFMVLINFTDGTYRHGTDPVFDSLKDCQQYKRLWDRTKAGLIGESVEASETETKEGTTKHYKEVFDVVTMCVIKEGK